MSLNSTASQRRLSSPVGFLVVNAAFSVGLLGALMGFTGIALVQDAWSPFVDVRPPDIQQ